jgi:hypothetical protein
VRVGVNSMPFGRKNKPEKKDEKKPEEKKPEEKK